MTVGEHFLAPQFSHLENEDDDFFLATRYRITSTLQKIRG